MPSMLEFYALEEPTPGTAPLDILTAIAPALYNNIDENGDILDSLGASAVITTQKGFNPPPWKHMGTVMAYGIVNEDEAYIDAALLGIGRMLSFRGDATVLGVSYTGTLGSFPAVKKGATGKWNQFHKKTLPLDKLCDALLLIKDSAYYTGARATTVDNLVSQIEDCALWMLDSPDLPGFMSTKNKANQMWSVASFLHKSGLLLENTDLTDAGQEQAEFILDNWVSTTGIFQEVTDNDPVGFDGNYHMVSAEMMARYWLLLSGGAFKTRMFTTLRRGMRRWLATCDWGVGIINDNGWSRTEETLPRVPGLSDINHNIIPLQLHLCGYVLGTACLPADLRLVADANIAVGQSFEHASRDDEDDDEVID